MIDLDYVVLMLDTYEDRVAIRQDSIATLKAEVIARMQGDLYTEEEIEVLSL